ncbi:unnamed protein product, partial [Bubo scandiacus]
MEESPRGRSPVFSGEEEGVNRRVSSGRLAPPPQLSSGAEGAPQSPHGWAGLFRGARTPPSYRREPEEGGGSGAGRAPSTAPNPARPPREGGGGGKQGGQGPAQLRG